MTDPQLHNQTGMRFRNPRREDGGRIHDLIRHCPPLDLNSPYAYLLLAHHFADTCVLAETDAQLVGALLGYRPPQQPDTFFVWQVAVSPAARGNGLAGRLLDQALAHPACGAIRFVEATITEDNHASWALFRGFARHRDTALHTTPLFERGHFLPAQHDAEALVRIGPMEPPTKGPPP